MLLAIIFIVLILVLIALVLSPGKTPEFFDDNKKKLENSISCIEKVTLGGNEQIIIIRGKNINNPILLFLHGGPGGSMTPIFHKEYPQLEDAFVVVYWEQRGAGKSFTKNIPKNTMTLNQFTEDANEVTIYIKKKFNREKIYIMGHSWGTMLGMNVIYRYPSHYLAYFGVGQIGNQKESEVISHNWLLVEAKKRHDTKAIKKLEKLDSQHLENAEEWINYLMVVRKYSAKYGGMFRNYSMKKFIKDLLLAKEFTLLEKINYYKGLTFSLNLMVMEFINFNLAKEITEIEVPVYFLQGTYDYDTTLKTAKDYFDLIQAPKKEFFVFNNSAHHPFIAETDLFHKRIQSLMKSNK